MRQHNGMRPQDIAVLLQIILLEEKQWQNKDLANTLFLSPAEIGISLERSKIAGLLNAEKRKVHRQTFLEFLQYGLHVVFPVMPGGIVNGLATAHAHPFMKEFFTTEYPYVWPYLLGEVRGQAIEPLYKFVPEAAIKSPDLYKALALLDVIRLGKVREVKFAVDHLKKMIHAPAHQYR